MVHAQPPKPGEGSEPLREAFKTLQDAYFLGYVPRPVVVVCIKDNPLAVAWHVPTNKNPLRYAVSISKENYSYTLALQGSDFTVNFLPYDHLDRILVAGYTHGNQVNKWELTKWTPIKALRVDVLMIAQALLVYECKQDRLLEFEDHILLLGRVELIHYKKGLKPNKVKYPLHMAKPTFAPTQGGIGGYPRFKIYSMKQDLSHLLKNQPSQSFDPKSLREYLASTVLELIRLELENLPKEQWERTLSTWVKICRFAKDMEKKGEEERQRFYQRHNFDGMMVQITESLIEKLRLAYQTGLMSEKDKGERLIELALEGAPQEGSEALGFIRRFFSA